MKTTITAIKANSLALQIIWNMLNRAWDVFDMNITIKP